MCPGLSQPRSTDDAIFSKALVNAEKRFSGGIVRGVRCANNKICMGSDRMSGEKHNYSGCYAKFLNKWRSVAERTQEARFRPTFRVVTLFGALLSTSSCFFGHGSRQQNRLQHTRSKAGPSCLPFEGCLGHFCSGPAFLYLGIHVSARCRSGHPEAQLCTC